MKISKILSGNINLFGYIVDVQKKAVRPKNLKRMATPDFAAIALK
jgi:hypothetical protein